MNSELLEFLDLTGLPAHWPVPGVYACADGSQVCVYGVATLDPEDTLGEVVCRAHAAGDAAIARSGTISVSAHEGRLRYFAHEDLGEIVIFWEPITGFAYCTLAHFLSPCVGLPHPEIPRFYLRQTVAEMP